MSSFLKFNTYKILKKFELTWYSDATTIYGTLEGQLDQIGYVLSEGNNVLTLTFPEGDEGVYGRLE